MYIMKQKGHKKLKPLLPVNAVHPVSLAPTAPWALPALAQSIRRQNSPPFCVWGARRVVRKVKK